MFEKNIPYSRQSINFNDLSSINRVLKSDYLTSGPITKEFEKKIASKVDAKFAISVNSATSALHISCMALSIKKNDIVWTSSISFVASANCAKYCGAKVEFLDIDENSFNIDVKKLEDKLIQSKKKNNLPKLIIPVHLGGNPCDMKKIYLLSRKYKFKIIEDASHALGSKYNNSKIGSCKYSDMTIFSFHPVKMITTAEGGVVTTNSKYLEKKLKIFREHGIVRDKKKFIFKNNIETYYEQQSLGYNYRLSDLHSALGISQIKRLTSFVKKRNEIRNIYYKELKDLPIKFQKIDRKNLCSYHLVIVKLKKNLRNKLFKFLRKNKINVNIHYIPIFYHPFYFKKKFMNNIKSIEYYNSAISLPAYYDLSMREVKKIIYLLKFFFNAI